VQVVVPLGVDVTKEIEVFADDERVKELFDG